MSAIKTDRRLVILFFSALAVLLLLSVTLTRPAGAAVDGRGIWNTVDSDADGMSDEWEEHFFGSVIARNGGEDDDLDDLTTLDEWHALANPLKLDPRSVGETGRLAIEQPDEVTWYPVRFSGVYRNPVVIVGPASSRGEEPLTVRVRNVTSTSFELQLDEYEYLDGTHISEEVGWLVVEAGRHVLPGGQTLVAGHVDVPSGGARMDLAQAMTDTNPVILSQVVTYNGGYATSPRHWQVNQFGFNVILQNQQLHIEHVATESLAWAMVDKGAGAGVRGPFEARATGVNVTDLWKDLAFTQSYPNIPVFLATVKTLNGPDPVTLRYKDLTNTGIGIRLVEEQSADTETQHGTHENVCWFAGLEGMFHILPSTGDSDADGLADAWENANGLQVGVIGGTDGFYGDLDDDGLNNAAEYLAGTRADLSDTDADGIDDKTEIEFYGSNALAADVGEFQLLSTIPGSAFVASTCPWGIDGSSAHINTPRGGVTYQFEVSSDGIYAADVSVSNRAGSDLSGNHEFTIAVNGEHVTRESLMMPDAVSTGTMRILTPWLGTGTHSISVFWDNTYVPRRINVDSVKLLRATGVDGNGNGKPDWAEIKLMRQNGVSHQAVTYGASYDEPVSSVISSYTSPYCLEGRARFPGLMDAGVHQPVPGPNDTWFLDVDLAEDDPTEVDLEFEGAAIHQTISIDWKTLNLIDCTSNLQVRQGDSIRLAAWIGENPSPADRTDLTVDGVEHLNIQTAEPLVVTFSTPGTHEIVWGYRKGNANGNQNYRNSGVLIVEVAPRVDMSSPICMVGFERSWQIVGLHESAVVQIDDDVGVFDSREPAPGVYQCSIAMFATESRFAVVRMGFDGPILGQTEIRGVRVASGGQTGVFNSGAIEGGGYLLTMPVYVGGAREGLLVEVIIRKAGVTFPDGSTRRMISGSEVDESGFITLTFIVPSLDLTNCHDVWIWNDGQRIGTNI